MDFDRMRWCIQPNLKGGIDLLKIATCDVNDVEQNLFIHLLGECAETLGELYTITCFSSGLDLLDYVNSHGYFDIIFIEAVLNGLNGIETVREIRQHNTSCQIIFVSSSDRFAVSSYSVDALYYMLKPVTRRELTEVLSKAVWRLREHHEMVLCIKSTGGLYSVRHNRIIYIESAGHKINFILDGIPVISIYGQLDEYEQRVNSDPRFIRIHKSYLVNADYIRYFGSDTVELISKKSLAVSRSFSKAARESYFSYAFGELSTV